jgi:preprotein translocase subunit Sec61beta
VEGRGIPEVVRLRDARGERPENAAGIGLFWYEPEVWALPISPAARVLYAGLCSFLAQGEINRKDLRATLKDHPDEAIAEAIDELVGNGLLGLVSGGEVPTYEVRSARRPEGER